MNFITFSLVSFFVFTSVEGLQNCSSGIEEVALPKIEFPEDFELPDFIKMSWIDDFEEIPNFEGRIVHGALAENRIFPYQAFILLYRPNETLKGCGGAIVTESWVLTAGHCAHRCYYASVGVGSNSRKKMMFQDSSVLVIHPEYDPKTLLNDIALIKLCKNLVFNEIVSAIRLPEPTCEDYVGKICTVSGFGGTEDDKFKAIQDLRYANVTIVPNKDVLPIYDYMAVPTLLFTIGKNNSGPCMGDSGGPLTMIHKKDNVPVLIGLVSFGTISCDKNPSAFTRVDKYLPWIKKYIFDIKK